MSRARRSAGFADRLRRSLLSTRHELEEQDERNERFSDTTAISDIPQDGPRRRATFGGVLASVTYPAAGETPLLRARLYDGTGTLELVFSGRRTVPGIEPGHRLRATGTPGEEGSGPVLYNPSIDLVTTAAESDR